MSARSYLSIGDVLTLLRQEFPDVTISKIRFLESQGLVNPERTPSGYRKFYEHDVERLRWVLRQQREHFLPLKVIKDRLEEDANGSGTAARPSAAKTAATVTPSTAAAAPVDPAAAPVEQANDEQPVEAVGSAEPSGSVESAESSDEPTAAEPVLVGQLASGAHRSEPSASGARTTAAAASSGSPGTQSGAGRPAPQTAGPGAGARASSVAPTKAAAPAPVERAHRASLSAQHTQHTQHTQQPHRADEPAHGSGNGTAGPSGHEVGTASTPGSDGSTAPSPAPGAKATACSSRAQSGAAQAPGTPTPAAERTVTRTPDPTPPPAATPGAAVASMGGMGGASLSLDELCAASGLSAEYVAQLQEYGLIRAAVVGGTEYFDEEALTVASVAAKFAAHGIEARHLRLYKNAADREAGFIEQIVIPMVRQRNPEARARASQTADELAALGQQLKGSLLRTGLRDLLNG